MILAALLALQTPPPQAGPAAVPPGWDYVGRSVTGARWFVDPVTATRTALESRVTVKIDYSEDHTVPQRRAQGVAIFNCDARTYRWESLGRYDAADHLIDPLHGTSMAGITPNSMVETVWRYACQRPA